MHISKPQTHKWQMFIQRDSYNGNNNNKRHNTERASERERERESARDKKPQLETDECVCRFSCVVLLLLFCEIHVFIADYNYHVLLGRNDKVEE